MLVNQVAVVMKYCSAVMTASCNGLCDPVETLARLHQDSNCTNTQTGELAMLDSWYDFTPVGCIKVDSTGNVNKTSCFEPKS